jgi:tetratricopeptide (TPR) repeat protein
MPSKLLWTLIAVALLGALGFFAWTNPSYQKAFEARWYYMTGNYDLAYDLAKEAYQADPYNRMAFTVMTQTEVAKKYLDYIEEGIDYLRRIETIAEKKPISASDRARIKLMCEVMIDRYGTLAATPLTDKELTRRAKEIHDKFQTLYDSLFKEPAIKRK